MGGNFFGSIIRRNADDDGKLVSYREYFRSLTAQQQERFAALVTGINRLMGGSGLEADMRLMEELGCHPNATVGVIISLSAVDGRTVLIDPGMLAEAVGCWAAGNEYLPGKLIE